ncbi:MAG: TylF/MycF family methyltransferase, partial [Cyclobacteriaceae bacterium]|nr:TylF/MycF family methyltransferase [Cyclobacteriaceae bacterium]
SLNKLVQKIKRLSKYRLLRIDTVKSEKFHDFMNSELEALAMIKKHTMLNKRRLGNIVEIMEYISKSKLQGDIVECGVWKGGSVALMAFASKRLGVTRKLHLFDAFDDICEPDAAVDGQRAIDLVGVEKARGRLVPIKGLYDYKGGSGNEEEVRNLIVNEMGYDENLVVIHKGWFQDTLPVAQKSVEKISFLRLDGDWYASTKVCLDYLYNKVEVGGVIVIDDYGAYEGCKKAVDEFLESIDIIPLIHKVDEECIYWVKTN